MTLFVKFRASRQRNTNKNEKCTYVGCMAQRGMLTHGSQRVCVLFFLMFRPRSALFFPNNFTQTSPIIHPTIAYMMLASITCVVSRLPRVPLSEIFKLLVALGHVLNALPVLGNSRSYQVREISRDPSVVRIGTFTGDSAPWHCGTFPCETYKCSPPFRRQPKDCSVSWVPPDKCYV